MVIVILSWMYYFLLCMTIGFLIEKILAQYLGRVWVFQEIDYLMAGIVGITVYAAFFSLFYKVDTISHLVLLLTGLVIFLKYKNEWLKFAIKWKQFLFSWEGFFMICFVLFIAFFTSRGTFHTDTNIYHAQNIRLYEEYGLIKGMANLQLHYGYNSLYLAFAAVMSLSWLLPWSLHTTTGFIEVALCIYALHRLKNFKYHKSHLEDAACVAILGYALINITGSISPATDYPTMFFCIYMTAVWTRAIEKRAHTYVYGLLSVFAVFLGTMKLSAIAMATVTVYPAWHLLKHKKWKEIGCFLFLGALVFSPYLLRNILISGWLIYPFEAIDLFQVDWKVPLEYLLVDAHQIKVWGRCLYDINLIDMPMKDWVPIWWANQERYAKMLLAGNVFGILLAGCNLGYKLYKKMEVRKELLALYLGLFASALLWFVLAPFIRYGLCFLLLIPLLSMASWFDYEKSGFQSIVTGGLVLLIFLCFSPYVDHYVTDDGVFIKQRLRDPYYIVPKDYDHGSTGSYLINGNVIYYNDFVKEEGERNSYHYFPNTAYAFMLERSTLVSDNIKDGFIPAVNPEYLNRQPTE